MSIELTLEAQVAAGQTNLEPQIVLEIEGVPTIYGSRVISKYIQYGDNNLTYGAGYVYGGLIPVENQEALISMKGTTTTITQQLNQDKAIGDSVSTINVALVDKNNQITELITPDGIVSELLGKKVKIWFGFEGTPWRDSFVIIFRGNISTVDAGQGMVTFRCSAPDEKKRANIFKEVERELTSTAVNFLPTDVNVLNDEITSPSHGLVDGQKVGLYAGPNEGDRLPYGLDSGYVIGATANTFKVSPIVGGGAYNIQDQGIGTHTHLSSMGTGATVVTVDDASEFLDPAYIGASGIPDDSIEFYCKIDDEIIRYTGKTANQLTGLTRGALGTAIDSHSDGEVTSFYRIKGNPLDLALKMMASGKGDFYLLDQQPTNFVRVGLGPSDLIANSIFFQDVDLVKQENIRIGDYITTTGATNGANNVSLKEIIGIETLDTGTYFIIDGVSFVEENATSALMSFRSQYDVWPEGAGLKMANSEIDIERHISLRDQFFSSSQMDFYLDETIEDAKEWISTELYKPISAFSLPRNGQAASLGVHFPPLPTADIKTINSDNIKNPHKLKIVRSLNKNFYNSIIYRIDRDLLESDKYLRGDIRIDGDSKLRFGDDVGDKTLTITANGMRTSLGAQAEILSYNQRRLNKYKNAAESIPSLELTFGEGFSIEIGDIVLLNMADTNLSDIKSGTRGATVEPRLFEVLNKKISLKGMITLELLDTNFDASARYGLVGLASLVESGSDGKNFIIKPSYNTNRYGINEYKKWESFIGAKVIVRNEDFSINGVSNILSISGNSITLTDDLGFTPLADYIFEFADYNDQAENVKLIYVFQQNNPTFDDGKVAYQML